jgi:NAD(P)-dependent dehydrogenase (short-subunit alcohol dehydrogenase family)
VNCIAPSLTDTPLGPSDFFRLYDWSLVLFLLASPTDVFLAAVRMTSSDSMRKALGDMHPIPRIGTADEVAALAEFLLDDATGGWISGQVFSVDGGRSTLRPKN